MGPPPRARPTHGAGVQSLEALPLAPTAAVGAGAFTHATTLCHQWKLHGPKCMIWQPDRGGTESDRKAFASACAAADTPLCGAVNGDVLCGNTSSPPRQKGCVLCRRARALCWAEGYRGG